jgi:hypothetical protein
MLSSELFGWKGLEGERSNTLIKFQTNQPNYENHRVGKLLSFIRELRDKIVLIKRN